MVSGFKKHPARAAIFQWLGISDRSLALSALAQEMFIVAYAEPRQTQTTRTATVEQLLTLDIRLPPTVSFELWTHRAGIAEEDSPLPAPYLYCRDLYRSNLIPQASTCFKTSMPSAFDTVRSEYFVGVIALLDRWLDIARHHVSKAEHIAKSQIQEPDITDVDIERSTGTLELKSGAVDEQHRSNWLDIHIRLHLSLGRLAAAQEQWALASRHYQYILPGHRIFFEASRERALVFDRLHKPNRAAATLVTVGQASAKYGSRSQAEYVAR